MSTPTHKPTARGATTMTNQKTRTNDMAGHQVLSTKGAASMSASTTTGPKKTFEEEKYSRDPMVAAAMDGLEAAATALGLFNMALREAIKGHQQADAWQYSRLGRMFGAAKKDIAEAEELMARLSRQTDC